MRFRPTRLSSVAIGSILVVAAALTIPAASALPPEGLPVPGCGGVQIPAGLPNPNPCSDPCQGQNPSGGLDPGNEHSPLCPFGPAGCVAIGLFAKLGPLTTQLARSTAAAGAGAQVGGPGYQYGYGFSQSDSHTAKADLPPELGSGAVESYCSASAYADSFGNLFNGAFGQADASQVYLDTTPPGGPATLYANALNEYGASFPVCTPPATNNCADVADLEVYNPSPSSNYNDVPANTMIAIGPLTLFLNEQFPAFFNPFGNCTEHDGDAARLTLGPATVIFSWVATCGS